MMRRAARDAGPGELRRHLEKLIYHLRLLEGQITSIEEALAQYDHATQVPSPGPEDRAQETD